MRENDVGAPAAFVLSRIVGRAWGPVAPEEYVGRIAPRPFVLVNGKDDHTRPGGVHSIALRARQHPKHQGWLQGQHVRPTRREVIEQMMDLVAFYLQREPQDP